VVATLEDTANDGGTRCHWRSVGHSYSYRRWRKIGASLAVLSGAFGAIAGSALLAGQHAVPTWQLVAGILGLAAAVAAAIEVGLGASRNAELHGAESRRWRELAARYWHFPKSPPEDTSGAADQLRRIQGLHAQLESQSEPLEGWAEKKATFGYERATGLRG
jgi:hypothetical protein